MFLKRNHIALGGKTYQSVLLVRGKRVPGRRPPGRPAVGAPEPKSVVVHETLGNLSKLPEDLIQLIERYCQGEGPPAGTAPASRAAPSPKIHQGPCYGLLAGLHALASESGLEQAVGQESRTQRLALYLI